MPIREFGEPRPGNLPKTDRAAAFILVQRAASLVPSIDPEMPRGKRYHCAHENKRQQCQMLRVILARETRFVILASSVSLLVSDPAARNPGASDPERLWMPRGIARAG
jgi:hypothetical protein